MRVFRNNPWLLIVLALVIIANDWFRFAPGQVLKSPLNIVIPGLFILWGILGYVFLFKEKKAEKEKEEKNNQHS